MMRSDDLKGVIPAIVTPFQEDGELDLDGLRRLTAFLLGKGIHGIMTTGGNGEFPHLSREEKRVVTETVVKETKGKVPIIAGTAACSTREALLLSRDAEEVGADAVIVTPPYFYRLPEASLYEHYRQLVEGLALPIIPYNNPLYTGHNLHPDLIDRIAGLKGIIGIKQSNADLGQLVECIRRSGDKISVCTGIDTQFYPSLCAGAKGIFSTAACVIPEHMVRIYDLFQTGNSEKAFAVHARIQELNTLFEYDPGYVAPCKEALRLLGLPAGPVREPLPALTAEELRAVQAALKNLGLL